MRTPISPPDPIDLIMPAYNAERWIPEAVRSALAVGPVRSLTIVDDGSVHPLNDAAAGACADARLTILRRPNGGEAAARNTGIDHLLGTTDPGEDFRSWVMFFDADDLLLPSCVDALDDARRAGAVACVAARESFRPDGRTERLDPPEDLRDAVFATPDDAFRYRQVFASTGMAVRRSVLRAGERWDEMVHTCPDIEILHRFAKRGPVWVSSTPVLRYRLHAGGENLSGFRHLARRIRGFIRTVELHATRANDRLLRDQADWLLNQQSKHGNDHAVFIELADLYRRRGWRMPLKPVVRQTVRRRRAIRA